MKISDYIKDNILYLDGGSGTLLQAAGLLPGELPEYWNITHPEEVTKIHRDYFDAGSNVIYTNTFGANSLKFSDGELEKIVEGAVLCAKSAREQSKATGEKFIALDLGPTGKLLKPLGDLSFEDCVKAYAKVISLGEKYGVDLIVIETMNDIYETKAALLSAKENSSLPVFVTNAYGEDGKLMTGASPEASALMLEAMGADAIGVNCSLGPDALAPVVERLLRVCSVPVICKPNAGLPDIIDGKTVFNVSPEEFAESQKKLCEKGVRILGGCCGTTPEYIKATVEKTKNIKPLNIEKKNLCAISSYTHAVFFGEDPVLIGERINPTGKKLLKEALRENNLDYILGEAISQSEKGAHILDVNVGLPEIDEGEMLTKVVSEIQAVCDLPLQIDTTDTIALEKALRIYNGKPLINSVNGKAESMAAVFPLAKKYGGAIIALTLDENGIPETAEGRFEIAKKIIDEAAKYGIGKNDLIFDTLAMAVSADKNAPFATLNALEMISKELGCNTSLGVSNVSFGLPDRDSVNTVFFANALSKGLSAAIMNPFSAPMMKTYYSHRALFALDENCRDYIANAENEKVKEANPASDISLKEAIEKGMKDKAASLCEILLKTEEPLTIINEKIIPALDSVGKGFEEKTVYLPQLLMSAEAANAAFDKVKKSAKAVKADKLTVVLATVKGDIHDIGKNIVKLLLENYGFKVVDLGRDTPAEAVLKAARETNAAVVGLSALMTTTVPAMEETVALLRKELPQIKIVVGGAVLTKEYADKMGADKYCSDAMETVRYCSTL